MGLSRGALPPLELRCLLLCGALRVYMCGPAHANSASQLTASAAVIKLRCRTAQCRVSPTPLLTCCSRSFNWYLSRTGACPQAHLHLSAVSAYLLPGSCGAVGYIRACLDSARAADHAVHAAMAGNIT